MPDSTRATNERYVSEVADFRMWSVGFFFTQSMRRSLSALFSPGNPHTEGSAETLPAANRITATPNHLFFTTHLKLRIDAMYHDAAKQTRDNHKILKYHDAIPMLAVAWMPQLRQSRPSPIYPGQFSVNRLQNSAIFAYNRHWMVRREFMILPILVNGRRITKVIVDPHYEKHRDITDDIILDLVRMLNGIEQVPDEERVPYEYYVTLLSSRGKSYRLVWLLERNEIYIGIITVYRDRRKQ
jgi:hypothetical protein